MYSVVTQNRVMQKCHSIPFELTPFFPACVSMGVNESEAKQVRFCKIIRRLNVSRVEFVFFWVYQCN